MERPGISCETVHLETSCAGFNVEVLCFRMHLAVLESTDLRHSPASCAYNMCHTRRVAALLLGVGVNVPIRTVLFTQLCKFDGRLHQPPPGLNVLLSPPWLTTIPYGHLPDMRDVVLVTLSAADSVVSPTSHAPRVPQCMKTHAVGTRAVARHAAWKPAK